MITQASKKRIGSTSFLPEVSAGISQMLQPVNIGIVEKTQVDGKTQEIASYKRTMAAIQPMKESLAIKKEGERSWKWFVLYMLPDPSLETDDVVVLFGTTYRVMDKEDWGQYGYVKYDLIEYYKSYGT